MVLHLMLYSLSIVLGNCIFLAWPAKEHNGQTGKIKIPEIPMMRSGEPTGKCYLLTIITILFMPATKRIPVTEAVWNELSDLKVAGQTYSQLLEEMIEDRKKARLFKDMERIGAEGEFVQLPW